MSDKEIKNEYLPDYAIHPGEHIPEELEARKMSVEKLAELSGLSVNTINDLIEGKISVDLTIAKKLGKVLGKSETLWMNLQKNYEAALERMKAKNERKK